MWTIGIVGLQFKYSLIYYTNVMRKWSSSQMSCSLSWLTVSTTDDDLSLACNQRCFLCLVLLTPIVFRSSNDGAIWFPSALSSTINIPCIFLGNVYRWRMIVSSGYFTGIPLWQFSKTKSFSFHFQHLTAYIIANHMLHRFIDANY